MKILPKKGGVIIVAFMVINNNEYIIINPYLYSKDIFTLYNN